MLVSAWNSPRLFLWSPWMVYAHGKLWPACDQGVILVHWAQCFHCHQSSVTLFMSPLQHFCACMISTQTGLHYAHISFQLFYALLPCYFCYTHCWYPCSLPSSFAPLLHIHVLPDFPEKMVHGYHAEKAYVNRYCFLFTLHRWHWRLSSDKALLLSSRQVCSWVLKPQQPLSFPFTHSSLTHLPFHYNSLYTLYLLIYYNLSPLLHYVWMAFIFNPYSSFTSSIIYAQTSRADIWHMYKVNVAIYIKCHVILSTILHHLSIAHL